MAASENEYAVENYHLQFSLYPVSFEGAPPGPRSSHVAAYVNSKLLILGGLDAGQRNHSVYFIEMSGPLCFFFCFNCFTTNIHKHFQSEHFVCSIPNISKYSYLLNWKKN